ncbi:MAG: DMT family transporter [Pseudomonadota bacterium]
MQDARATALILGAMVCFAVQDAIVKLTAGEVSLWQMQLIRSIFVLIFLALVLRVLNRLHEMRPTAWGWPLARAFLMAGAYLFFYAALPYLPLAQAAAAFFIGPILITVLAAIFLGEPIGPRRVAAVLVGFAGVLCIVRPGLEGWNPMALLPVAAAGCYAMAVVLTRWRCREVPGFALTTVHTLIFATVGTTGLLLAPMLPISPEAREEFAFLTTGWHPLALWVAALFALTAATHITGALSSVQAYKEGEASRLAPFEYSYLVIMALIDYAVWGEVPAGSTLLGMALICGAGGFVAWREGRPARPRIQQNAEVPWTPEQFDDDPSMPPDDTETAPSRMM